MSKSSHNEVDIATLASEAHVVFLLNFVAPDKTAIYQEVAKRIGRLTILSSVAVESNRHWDTEWGDLNVVLQKNWTITRHPRHPSGYREVNYIHVPVDTIGQLRRLRPDAVVSIELGARTLLSTVYRKMNRKCAHVAAVNASHRTETGRGRLRQFVRRGIVSRVDRLTYNGPECRELLLNLGADSKKLSPWGYAADPNKPYMGPLKDIGDRKALSLITVGELSDRKGVIPAAQQLAQWAQEHPDHHLTWNVIGTGPLEQQMKSLEVPSNLRMRFHGFCGPEEIREQYHQCDVMLFPTLGDEWGLVVDEALWSGLPVIGSCHAQATVTLVRSGVNGMVYDPDDPNSLGQALDRFMALQQPDFERMPQAARDSVAARTAQVSADQIIHALSLAIADRRGLDVTAIPDLEQASDSPRSTANCDAVTT